MPPLLDADRLAAAPAGRRGPLRPRQLPARRDARAFRVDALPGRPRRRAPASWPSAISRRKHDEALRELLLQLTIADLIALVAASFVGYRTARAALDPVERYRRAVERHRGGRPGRGCRSTPGRDDELSRLGDTFNDLLDRIEASAERERQFLADASHELRTPLSLMRTELEWAPHRPRSDAETAEVLGLDAGPGATGSSTSPTRCSTSRSCAARARSRGSRCRSRTCVRDAVRGAAPTGST